LTTNFPTLLFRRQFLPLLRNRTELEILHFSCPVRGRRPCWRLLPRKALFLRQVTPTWSGFSRPDGALVGAFFPAKPYSFVEPRQHGPVFHGLPAPLLAPSSPQSLIPSLSHANMVRFFTVCRRPCWRLLPRKALFLRQGTPTWSGFSRPAGALVGAFFPAKKNLHPGSNLGLPMGSEPIGKRLLTGCSFFLFFWMMQVFFQALLDLVLKFLDAVGIPMHFPGLLC